MKQKISKLVTLFAIVSLFLFLIGPELVSAASLSALSDTMSREKISTNSSHTIKFTSTSAIAAGNTIVIAFPSGFTTTGLVIGDLQICHGTSTGLEDGAGASCTSNDETIAASNGASTVWGAAISGTTTITLTAPSGTPTHPISAGYKVTIIIASTHMVNPSSTQTPNITITTTSDSGSVTVPIVDDDTVSVSASVNETVSFDINTSLTGSASTAPYSVPLGTLSASAVTESNGSSINEISITGGTNASGGMAVTVSNANGASGLKSTSTPTDTIPSATATMAAGTANYGLCVATAGLVGWTRAGSYGTTCASNSGTNSVVGLTTTPASMLSSTGPLATTAYANVIVNAEVNSTTPAHTDYADTLDFDGTATF